ncbi:ribonuclease D [Microbacterium testaceum]|uniref:ribonuclease D n=1 Tax=Microbacterium TaxID=33882 RepID=UPI0022715DE8|nr:MULTISPECIES: HRDC domain-containing protein [Microbacterium]MDQ1113725.1 ribonuclease D [Microbacterium testaceum]MDQ1177874.1 ribonuclease D [Microbacterium sp. SORGH_AS_0421]MDR6099174.1 ribonuclease D [Microbacterium sp. SORGH_AS_0454]WAC68855.1 HRDC domain-containing protein [Microbacterium sp. SL75]
MVEYIVIEDAAGFLAACETLNAGSGPVAVDVERASGFRYSQRAYLIQVFRREAGVFLFDPSTIEDFSPLQDAIGDVEWVFHAASQDLPSLRERGLEPPRIFDTELGSRLLGHERVGLGAVVEQTLGITLAKAHSAADWSTRPLPASWLEYAALDVEHLIDVRDVLDAELTEQDKTEIARQEFQAVLDREPKPPRDDPWRRLSGLHSVRGRRSLAVARSLWQAREDYAREQDIAPGRLVPDRALVAAVLADPASKQALAGVKEFNGRASRTQLDRWWNAIVAGRESTDLPADRVPSDTLPPPRAWADRNPEADRRLKKARPAVEARAEELRMPTENLLTPETLRRLAWAPPAELTADSVGAALAELGARPWQIDQTSQVIADSFVASLNTDDDGSATDS